MMVARGGAEIAEGCEAVQKRYKGVPYVGEFEGRVGGEAIGELN
jgi:hypothetical protein